jgi:hypothetical protein
MSITVGLDFGTHQTKICIQDATNPNQKTYEFFDFSTKGKSSYFLPSVVQINEDGTVSYGLVNENRCKKVTTGFIKDCIPNLHLPIINQIPEPFYSELPAQPIKNEYPSRPNKIPYPKKPTAFSESNDWKSILLALKNKMQNKQDSFLDDWKEQCKLIDYKNDRKIREWEIECENIDQNNNSVLNNWLKECESINKKNDQTKEKYLEELTLQRELYNSELNEYNFKRNQFQYLTTTESGKILEEKLFFHYFKFALYTKEVDWLHQYDPETISIWYIANILFLLREKYGEEFYIQMGIPCGIQKTFHDKQKVSAICVLIAAYNLIDCYQNHAEFLNSSYEDLLSKTQKVNSFSEDDLLQYGVNALPEAYAGLISLTQKKKLEHGMSLLVDIGGGTTDIAFFTITEDNLPDIHAVHSLFKGLNYVFEDIALKSVKSDIVKIQKEINYLDSNPYFTGATNKYKRELTDATRLIINSVKDAFINRNNEHRLHIGKLNQALINRPVIYSGGGSTFESLVDDILTFTDKKKMNKELLSINNLKTNIIDGDEFSILSTAYGLSIPLENEIKLTDIKGLFEFLVSARNDDEDHNSIYGIEQT